MKVLSKWVAASLTCPSSCNLATDSSLRIDRCRSCFVPSVSPIPREIWEADDDDDEDEAEEEEDEEETARGDNREITRHQNITSEG